MGCSFSRLMQFSNKEPLALFNNYLIIVLNDGPVSF